MKNIRKIILIILVAITFITSNDIFNVEAATTAPSKFTVKDKSSLYYYSESKGTDYISGYNFYRKQFKNGTYAYCVNNINTKVPASRTLTRKGAITDKGLSYIIENGWPNKSMTGNALKDYYITQSAIWEYFDQTRGSNNWHSTSFPASSTGMKKHVYNLVSGAKVAKKAETIKPSITVSVSNTTMTLNSEKTFFVSSPINVELTNTDGTFTVELVNAPAGTIIKNSNGEIKTVFQNGESLVVYVPVSSVKVGTSGSVSFKVRSMGVTYKTYYYTTGDPAYQDLAPSEKYKVTIDLVSAPITLDFARQTTKVKISKQDITSKQELPGATLTVKDKNGKVIDEWVSTNEPHYIEGIEPGEYTLTEKIAPNGYVLSKETITFTVKADGSVTNVVMYNSKEIITRVKISKQDIASKQELPGATLTVKDKNGKVIDEWVSTNEPHYIEGLKPGEYTLTEKIAPNGYLLSNETITFTVKADGSVTSVVMYNAKETKTTKVKISKQDITSKQELPGATLTIKDKNGNVIDEWVSTNEPHYIEGLEPGEYTLSEKKAPDGYLLSEEIITFTVRADGSVTNVVMYNTRYVEVPKTDLNVSSWTAIIAAVLITLGTGMVVYYVKYTK